MEEQNTPPSNRLGLNKEHLAAYKARRESIARLTEEYRNKYTYEQLAEFAAEQSMRAVAHEELISHYEKAHSINSELLRETVEGLKGSISVEAAAKFTKAAIDAREAPKKQRRKEIYASSLGVEAKAKEQLIERAQKIAAEEWGKNRGEVIRAGAMADIVYKKLIDEGFLMQLPGEANGIRKWIKPVTPKAASRPGRAPNKPTDR